MNYRSIKICATLLLFTVMARHCVCLSSDHRKKTLEQRKQLAMPRVTCSVRGIRAVFGPLVKNNVYARDVTGATVPVLQSDKTCGVRVGRAKNQSLSFFSRYDSCFVHVEGSKAVIPLQVQLAGEDRWIRVNISCPLIKTRSERTQPRPTPFPGNCDIERALRVDCGHQSVSSDVCYKLGCCYDARDSACYYTLNACSLDGHFVFSVNAADAHTPIDPSSLIVKDQPHCHPVVTTPDTAVFKIGVSDCGAKRKANGDVVIYEVEVVELHTGNDGKNSQFSLQVQCEYDSSDLKHAAELRSLYAVTNPPPVIALGSIRVQMRIATDASFTSFIPEEQLPLTLPLREAVNVEISIVQPSPDPTLSLRVRDCFAYPGSRHSVWTLLYDGCPNPQDNMRSSVPVDKQGKTTSHSQVRRPGYLISLTQMYFYCWVEICTNDVDCSQRCTFISSEGERPRREATSQPHQLQLVSLGPLQLVQNNTEAEEDPCMKQEKMFQVTVYILSGVGAGLLLVLLFFVCSRIRRRQNRGMQRARDEQDGSEASQ
ncbi:zona pellucida sperm-binding protein 4-like isoform X2 [Oreochromis aureus]|uniref:zona pellucida sperm-binding protein 4-like isoform X2 n=1 Tax=Oreochromis aureus TaxID=47969 RepID=UPI001953782E|nr:zona pellucida sperm-binding protein 4-like isoform X2 [Oreochromis aureus]